MGESGLAERLFKSRRTPPTLALVCVVLLASWMALDEGGYFTWGWGPVALLLSLLTIFVSAVGYFRRVELRPALPALGLFAAFAGWSFASILWASDGGAAWEGAGQTLLYLLGFWAAVALISMGASRRWVLVSSVAGPAAVAALTLLALGRAGAESFFEGGRLEGSIGYYNGEAGFLLLPFWVGIYLAGSQRMNPLVRGSVLGGVVLCADLAILSQSRGAMVASAVSIPLFFLLSGQRLRGLLALLPVVGAVAFAFPALNAVYLAGPEGDIAGVLGDALPLVWIGALVAGLYGLLWGLVDLRWRPPELFTRVAGAAALIGVAVLILGGGILLNQRTGGMVEFASAKWEAFKTNDTSGSSQSRFLSASGSNRFTLWGVAVEDFRENPVAGVGVQNYEATYYQLRERGTGDARQPHSLPLEVLAERGLAGGVLFFGFLGVCAGAGLWKRFSRLGAEGKAQVGALLAAAGLWFVYASSEWFWQLPAVTLVAVVYMALLVAPWRRGSMSGEELPNRLPLRLAGAGVGVAAILVVAPLWASGLLSERAEAAQSPQKALPAVELARNLNPLSPELAVQEASLAADAGAYDRAEASYRDAISLNPDHYAPYMFLATYYERRGELGKAQDYYGEAVERNPLGSELQRKLERLES